MVNVWPGPQNQVIIIESKKKNIFLINSILNYEIEK
jgi:hypothetical protein